MRQVRRYPHRGRANSPPSALHSGRYPSAMAGDASHLASAFGLGFALGSAPGPVQMVLLTESARGGAGRGFRAMAGANGTFGALVLAVAAGVSLLSPTGAVLRALRIVGGSFLLVVAADAFATAVRASALRGPGQDLHPAVRGVLAVLLNPGAWLFLATTASALMADAARDGGRVLAFEAAAAM